MANNIHPSAVIAEDVILGDNITIGPHTVILEGCEIGDNCVIDANVKIGKWTSIGAGTYIYFGAIVGEDPQDHRFDPKVKARTTIGKNAVIREYVTIHRSPFEGGLTSIGDGTLLMAFVHVGHDGRIGNYVTVANNTAFSGHVIIEDYAVISGFNLFHQFCRIGSFTMISARNTIRQDTPPYCMVTEDGCVVGPNVVGLRRGGFTAEQRTAIKKAIKTFYFKGLNNTQACEVLQQEYPDDPVVGHFIEFVSNTERGLQPGNPEMVALGTKNADKDDEE